jgi:hypothetical protein
MHDALEDLGAPARALDRPGSARARGPRLELGHAAQLLALEDFDDVLMAKNSRAARRDPARRSGWYDDHLAQALPARRL